MPRQKESGVPGTALVVSMLLTLGGVGAGVGFRFLRKLAFLLEDLKCAAHGFHAHCLFHSAKWAQSILLLIFWPLCSLHNTTTVGGCEFVS